MLTTQSFEIDNKQLVGGIRIKVVSLQAKCMNDVCILGWGVKSNLNNDAAVRSNQRLLAQ